MAENISVILAPVLTKDEREENVTKHPERITNQFSNKGSLRQLPFDRLRAESWGVRNLLWSL
jgi:hypothetical protein